LQDNYSLASTKMVTASKVINMRKFLALEHKYESSGEITVHIKSSRTHTIYKKVPREQINEPVTFGLAGAHNANNLAKPVRPPT